MQNEKYKTSNDSMKICTELGPNRYQYASLHFKINVGSALFF